MNKQEAIERIESRAFNIEDTDLVVGLSFTKNIINQINEQQKVVIPKFVATWIEHCKQSNLDLDNAMRYTRVNNAETGVEEWIYENQETFARAWLDGYEVEQERLYTVEIPNPHAPIKCHSRLAKNYKGKVVLEVQDWLNITESYKLTESEIKQDFEWAWDAGFYEPVEVE
ncbi:DUF1642 domain-containing protein [Streptococcus sp. 2022WUSS037]|uniref:DUF1642 domain-containing protein n=1 Tax=Streptococcus sp. 2022WUSS037 TaxID=2983286 RepID=UPI0037B02789